VVLTLLVVAAASLVVAAVLIGRLRPWLRGTLAGRAGPRAIPSGAGVAVVTVVLAAAGAGSVAQPALAVRLAACLAPAGVVALVSLRDDFRPLSALLRLAVHVAAAATAVAVLGPVTHLSIGDAGAIDVGGWAWPLTVLWIVGLTNAFNFMDGSDGLAGITAAAAGIALALAAAALALPAVAITAAALAGGSLGFLAWNWPPARVFLGDVGSTFCGFVVATLSLVPEGPGRGGLLTVAFLAVWPFVFDAGFTLLGRIVRGENVLEPHTGHLYQRLVSSGWSHRGVATLYGGLAAMSAAVGAAPLVDPSCTHVAPSVAAATVVVGSAVLLALAVASGLAPGGRPAAPSTGARA
jgi:UDP-N-acetylmuramyl pentapeptide phosphotransferase/UDP-N-acetylglucosamine-1-phosphate transferase